MGVCPTYEHICIYTLATILADVFMEWQRLVGSLKLQVSFAKEPYKRDYILQKRSIILRSLLLEATPYPILIVQSVSIAMCRGISTPSPSPGGNLSFVRWLWGGNDE